MTAGPEVAEINDNREIQENEKEAIESTYGEQVTFKKLNRWQVWHPNDVYNTLHAFDSCLQNPGPSGLNNISIVLHVKCSEDYPTKKPLIELLEPRGISNERVADLLRKLNKLAEENVGQQVIYILSEEVRAYLSDHVSHLPAGSFHDTMLANKAKTEAEEKQRISERKRLDTERSTEQKDLEVLEEEMRQRNAVEMDKTLDGKRPEGETRTIGDRRIVVLANIPIKRAKPSSNCKEWMGFWENMQILISEWSFRYHEGGERNFKPFLHEFDSVYNDIKKLCEIKSLDQNLVEYAFVHQEKAQVAEGKVIVKMFVAQKIGANEENLEETYEYVAPKPHLVRLLAVQAICALRYLHESGLTHKYFTRGTVWTRDCTGNCIFRFSDFEATGQLIALTKMFNETSNNQGTTHDELEKSSRKNDLFQLGSILDGLVFDLKTCSSNYSRAPTPNQTNHNFPNLLNRFIEKCQGAKNIDQIVEEPFLKEECQSESENIFTPFGGTMNPEGRMLSDNVIIRGLGKGGFGDVVLVRNKMDSTDYAIKRIPLNSGGEKMNKKIAKEAKYFAKLNHPNMVRYFNAWAEELIPINDTTSDEDSAYMGAVPIPGRVKGDKKTKLMTGKSVEDKNDPLGGGDSLMPVNLRSLAQDSFTEAKEYSAGGPKCVSRIRPSKISSPNGGLKNLSECLTENDDEFSVDWDAESEEDEEEEDESSEDEDEEESKELKTKNSVGEDSVFERSFSKTDEDDDVVFTGESGNEKPKELSSIHVDLKSISDRIENIVPRNPRILCIQMEYCDRQTLRQHIDENCCYKQPKEVWRIFGEILRGLKYMHDMSMIHRDIKPLNIFLTSGGGVKIGDFGLATLEAMHTKGRIVAPGAEKSASLEGVLSPNGYKSKVSEYQQTRDIGTQLYMAPELFVDETALHSNKIPYTSKIDIYSAGVVLFEMFYQPLRPGMERVSTLNNLRDQIVIPDSFGEGLDTTMRERARKTVERMLDKNPDERPSASALLNDDELPTHTKEDSSFQKSAEKVIKKRDCRLNQWLVETQLKEDVSALMNYRYDYDVCVDRHRNQHREAMVETLREQFCKVLKIHSFEKVHTHTLLPVSTALASASVISQPAKFLDQNAIPIALPQDLRQNFVRYCVRNGVQRLKRFNFGRVYSQNLKNGVHPNEKWECCVDSIGPESSSTSLEAELLLVACEMISKALPGMKLTLKIGHAKLLEAQIRYLKLSDDARIQLLNLLHIISVADRNHSLKDKMEQLSPKIGHKAANIITKMLIPVENNFDSFKEKVGAFRKKLKDNSVRELADHAITDLEAIITTFKLCRSDELQKISIVYDSQTCYRPKTFGDGLVFQIQVEKKASGSNKNIRKQTVLAGGRYDSALLRERHSRDHVYENPLCISGFGCPMDVVAQMRDYINKNSIKSPLQRKVLICSLVQPDDNHLIKEKFIIAKRFWSMDIEADVFHNPIDDVETLNEHREHASISHILAVTNPEMQIIVKTKESSDMVDLETAIQTVCRSGELSKNQSIPITPNGGPSSSVSMTGDQSYHEDNHCTTPVAASKSFRSASASALTNIRTITATVANLNVLFTLTNDKYFKTKEKKRLENVVQKHLQDWVAQHSQKTKIDVLLCDLPTEVVKKIVSELTKSSTVAEIDTLFAQLIQQHGKIDLNPISRQLKASLHGPSAGNTTQLVIVFYRIADNFYRCLT